MQLTSTLAWLVDAAAETPTSERFLANLGSRLIKDGAPLSGGALTLRPPTRSSPGAPGCGGLKTARWSRRWDLWPERIQPRRMARRANFRPALACGPRGWALA